MAQIKSLVEVTSDEGLDGREPRYVFEDPVLVHGELLRRGNGIVAHSLDDIGMVVQPELVRCAKPGEGGEFSGWVDVAEFVNLKEAAEQLAPHLAGAVRCDALREAIVFRDGLFHIVGASIAYADKHAVTLRHPLPIGTRIRSLDGESDGNGIAEAGSVGVVGAYLGNLNEKQGHAYDVFFPITEHVASGPHEEDVKNVWVVLDQGDSIDDEEMYVVLEALKEN